MPAKRPPPFRHQRKIVTEEFDQDAMIEKASIVAMRRTHAIVIGGLALLVQALGFYGAYVKAMGDMRQEIAVTSVMNKGDMTTLRTELRLEREQLYVKKDEFQSTIKSITETHQAQLKSMTDKLDKIGADVSSLAGFIQGRETKK